MQIYVNIFPLSYRDHKNLNGSSAPEVPGKYAIMYQNCARIDLMLLSSIRSILNQFWYNTAYLQD